MPGARPSLADAESRGQALAQLIIECSSAFIMLYAP